MLGIIDARETEVADLRQGCEREREREKRM
jgi:hypothetical protein